MRLLNIIDEDVVNYKKISMYIAFPHCSLKCNIDYGKPICQNSSLVECNIINVDGDNLIKRYLSNPLSKAIVIGGLEPFDSRFDLITLIDNFRNKYNCDDDIVIYTGYTEDELTGNSLFNYVDGTPQSIVLEMFKQLKKYNNIIVKFGRFIPDQPTHYDPVLGVNLASNNQYAKVLN